MSNAVSFHPTDETIISQEPLKDVEPIVGGNNLVFNMRVHQSKIHLSDTQGHDVVFNMTFAMAIPGVFTNTRANESFSTRNSSVDPLRNNNQYFHIEFDLFDKGISKEPYKTDVAFYGTFAKIYPDRSESQVVPTWSDGEDTWICWIQRFSIRVTLSHIESLCSHNMQIKVWDTKEKCTAKVRFDHPKAPKPANRSKSTNEMTNWIKQTVLMISRDYSNTASFLENPDRILPHQIISSRPIKKVTEAQRTKSAKSNATTKSSATSPESSDKEKTTLVIYSDPKEDADINLGSYGQIERLLDTKSANKRKIDIKVDNSSKKPTQNHSARVNEQSHTFRSESHKSVIIPADQDKYNKYGRIILDINTCDLFLSDNTMSRTPSSIGTLEDMFCMITIESNLLSTEQSKALNPLTINIKKIENLPNKSTDFSELNRVFEPLYCKYQFSNKEPHKTVSRLHNRNIKFDDVSVVLTGTLDKLNLLSQMQNNFLTIKLYDRVEKEELETEDNYHFLINAKTEMDMGDINITSSKSTITRVTSDIPRGEAKIDLSDMIKKRLKYLEVMVPICPISVTNGKHEQAPNRKWPEDNCGTYLEAGTTIKVSFKLAEYVDLSPEISHDKYYNRIVVVCTNRQCEFITKKMGIEILKHNCKKLDFKSERVSEMQTFLYSTTIQSTADNDLFTGVYIVDRKCEVLIVESSHRNIMQLYGACCGTLDSYQDRFSADLKLLYNESLFTAETGNFQILTMLPLRLSKDMAFFVAQPLFYVRDMLPRECVEGICKINELVSTDSMHIALRNKLIPTSNMIESISQYLCSHIIGGDDDDTCDVSKPNDSGPVRKAHRNDIKTAPLGERQKIKPQITRSKTNLSTEYIYPKKECEFSYSCQTLNSTSSAKEIIRQKMDPNRRYTYSQNYLFSGSFDPVDIGDEYSAEENVSKIEPKWINKEYRSTIQDIISINTLPKSRREELKEKWIENTLHKSFMEPTLPERDQTTYKFDLYIRPLKVLDRDANSIMPSYVEQTQSNKHKKDADHEIWKRKVCVSDIQFRSHRLLPETEMTERGRTSSNQISKLNGLRKDEIRVKQRYDANNIPATYVIPVSQKPNGSYTVGPDKDRNLFVNYVPVIKHDRNFNLVYQSSKDNPIYKNIANNYQARFESPFSVYT